MKSEINRYLFDEFGVEGDPDQVDDCWPFELTAVGEVEGASIFEFASDGEEFFAVCGSSLNFFPRDGFSLDDLRLQFIGSRWIGERKPVDLNTSRGEHPVIPRVPDRRAAIESLGRGAFADVEFTIVEGLFLETTREYVALLRSSESPTLCMCGTSFRPVFFPDSASSKWRLLAKEVGRAIEEEKKG